MHHTGLRLGRRVTRAITSGVAPRHYSRRLTISTEEYLSRATTILVMFPPFKGKKRKKKKEKKGNSLQSEVPSNAMLLSSRKLNCSCYFVLSTPPRPTNTPQTTTGSFSLSVTVCYCCVCTCTTTSYYTTLHYK